MVHLATKRAEKSDSFVEVKELKKSFSLKHGKNLSVINVPSFCLGAGDQLAIFGGSGSGKSTFLNFRFCWGGQSPPDQGGHRSIRSIDRPIESIDSIDSIIFRSFENFWKDRLRRDDRFRPKIVKIRAILAIFRPFENFCEFRFDRFDIPFDSIDIASEGHGGPPC